MSVVATDATKNGGKDAAGVSRMYNVALAMAQFDTVTSGAVFTATSPRSGIELSFRLDSTGAERYTVHAIVGSQSVEIGRTEGDKFVSSGDGSGMSTRAFSWLWAHLTAGEAVCTPIRSAATEGAVATA